MNGENWMAKKPLDRASFGQRLTIFVEKKNSSDTRCSMMCEHTSILQLVIYRHISKESVGYICGRKFKPLADLFSRFVAS